MLEFVYFLDGLVDAAHLLDIDDEADSKTKYDTGDRTNQSCGFYVCQFIGDWVSKHFIENGLCKMINFFKLSLFLFNDTAQQVQFLNNMLLLGKRRKR